MAINRLVRVWIWTVVFCGIAVPGPGADGQTPTVSYEGKQLQYVTSERGDRVPDYSYCGYEACEIPIPFVPTRIVVQPQPGDDTSQLQAAIDAVASMPLANDGWRGAVQLAAGRFEVSGSLRLHGTHVVLRGTADGPQLATTIVATGPSRRPLIRLGNTGSRPSPVQQSRPIANVEGYVPIGADQLTVDNAAMIRVGQTVKIEHPSTAQWIAALEMNRFPSDDGRGSWLDWKPGTMDQSWSRRIVAVDDHSITLDAPLTSALDPSLAKCSVFQGESAADHHLGIEHLILVSQAATDVNVKDEEHAWDAIRANQVDDAWVRNVTCRNFAGSAVCVSRAARRVSVLDCQSIEPVSEIAGWRRHTFYTQGQQTLFLRCSAEGGRHDFSVAALTSGPNAFVDCHARGALDFSGPVGSWASGVLFDNVTVDGASLCLTNRETEQQGAGWCAANCMLWNCVAPKIVCRRPPTAWNWAVGIWGEFTGNGHWQHMNEFTDPRSLYIAQLEERVGGQLAAQAMAPTSGTGTDDSATRLVAPPADKLESIVHAEPSVNRLRLVNGWLAMGDRLLVGSRLRMSWWRGSVLPDRAREFGPGLTRFVPGRDEAFYTDDVIELADGMRRSGQVVLEHHWGLWYDRRRDDHQMVRRIDGEAWPPFYEQPWARSGQGIAFDGLSKYDLSRFNEWYFDRLQQFASQADQHGLVLMQMMYFQHNILEAGAHWTDFPWRPANCLQATGFPEPPDYQNRKRVFMADEFYDVGHPVRRTLHQAYINHCLDTLAPFQNVLFVLGEEYTGPAHFMEFWLETIEAWQQAHDRDVLVVLSATRDVQEKMLADERLSKVIDVVDVKYWWFTPEGDLYDPPGGENLAPRQQLRQWSGPKSRSGESLARSVREVRQRFPDKAVICSLDGDDPMSTCRAGGSMVALPQSVDPQWLREVVAAPSR